MALVNKVSEQIENFIRRNRAFQDACELCFEQADKNRDGRISALELVTQSAKIFVDLEDVLSQASIEIEVPSEEKVKSLLAKADLDHDNYLNEKEFAFFYEQLLKLAAFNAARGFIVKNGAAILAGAGSAIAIYTGKEKLDIPEQLKPYIEMAAPLISVVVAAITKMGISNAQEAKAEKRLFRTQCFKKDE